MSTEAGFKKTLRDQPWDWKTKNDYEEVTLMSQNYVHQHFRNVVDGKDMDIYDPRYTKLKCSDWEAFRDPKKFWYTTYIANRKKLVEELEGGFENTAALGIINRLPSNWVNAMRDLYTPLRHLEYGISVQMQYVMRYTMGCPIDQCATYQAYDKIGRAQWITQWAINMEEAHENFLDYGKDFFLNSPEWKPLRTYVEEVLAIEDWAEVLVATNLTLDMLINNLFYKALNEEALKQGDTHLVFLNLAITKQADWNRDWAFNFMSQLYKDPATSRWDYLKPLGYEGWTGDYRWGRVQSDPRLTPEDPGTNAEIIGGWIEKWYKKAYPAILALEPLFKKYDLSMDLATTLKKVQDEDIIPYYQKYGLPY